MSVSLMFPTFGFLSSSVLVCMLQGSVEHGCQITRQTNDWIHGQGPRHKGVQSPSSANLVSNGPPDRDRDDSFGTTYWPRRENGPGSMYFSEH